MKKVNLIVVGKLKNRNLIELENDYIKRIKSLDFSLIELKASAEQKNQECQNIIQKINDLKKDGKCYLIALDETGKHQDSVEFSKFIYEKLDLAHQLIFVIGGAEGLNQTLKEQADFTLCLSDMTLPHKLARLFFIEQLYRAITIKEGHPYHN